MTACKICRSAETEALLTRAQAPVHQNLIFRDRAQALAVPRGDIRLQGCYSCGFVWNAAFDLSRLSYGEAYDHSQGHSAAYRAHYSRRVRRTRKSLAGASTVVEIGCGRGGFLKAVVDGLPQARGLGLDPSYQGPAMTPDGRVRFIAEPFSADQIAEADAVILRHVVAHLPDPQSLFERLASHSARRMVRLVIETPDLAQTVKENAFFDLFYEYCSYFSTSSLAAAVSGAGFGRLAIRPTYDRQYLWLEASTGGEPCRPHQPQDIWWLLSGVKRMGSVEQQTIGHWRERLAVEPGKVALWGAAAKGATFAALVDPKAELIPALIDNNPAKHGSFIGGAGHPILSAAEAVRTGARHAVVMNPLYLSEIQKQVDDASLPLKLVSLN